MKALVSIALIVAWFSVVGVAQASMPVRRTITGCVVKGTLISDDGYQIRVRRTLGGPALDLRRYEGRRISVGGLLSPGDVFVLHSGPAALGACRRR